MATRYVEYNVPVLAEVDDQTGKVSRVLEYNDSIEATGKVFAEDKVTELEQSEASHILDLVDGVGDSWPARESA